MQHMPVSKETCMEHITSTARVSCSRRALSVTCVCGTGNRLLGRLLMELPYALGSLSYLTGAHLYKRAALEGYGAAEEDSGQVLSRPEVGQGWRSQVTAVCELLHMSMHGRCPCAWERAKTGVIWVLG